MNTEPTDQTNNSQNQTSPLTPPAPTAPTAPNGATGANGATNDAGTWAPDARSDVRYPRTGPIVWGVLVLVFCLYFGSQMLAPGSIDTATFMIAAVIGLGVLLLGVGITVIVRSQNGKGPGGRG